MRAWSGALWIAARAAERNGVRVAGGGCRSRIATGRQGVTVVMLNEEGGCYTHGKPMVMMADDCCRCWFGSEIQG